MPIDWSAVAAGFDTHAIAWLCYVSDVILARIFAPKQLAPDYTGDDATESGGDDVKTGDTVIPVTLTGYYPTTAQMTAAQARMEGGPTARGRAPLYTLQQHRADPSTYPYASLACDWTIFDKKPYGWGQRVKIDGGGFLDSDVLRLVDTGGHFYNDPLKGAHKVIHVAGHEPVDVRVDGPSDWPGRITGTMTIIPGDTLRPGV